MPQRKPDTLIVLDFGSQYAQLIVRRVREAQVYTELFPWNTPEETVLAKQPRGFILSGGPASIYQPDAPQVPAYVLNSGMPILGICYGMQALAHVLGGRVTPADAREYGHAELEVIHSNPLIPTGHHQVWMSHGDAIERLPPGFTLLARTKNAPFAAMGDLQRRIFGVQFHPEVHHTPEGGKILRKFAVDICGAKPTWTPENILAESVQRIQEQVGDEQVLAAVSGGVDSTVATTLTYRAIGEQLTAIFVNNGLLRAGEPQQVINTLGKQLGSRLIVVDAVTEFMHALDGITEPERKREIIGELFIRIFERQAEKLGGPRFLVQGTIYPDVVESSAPDRSQAERIKTHHNVGGLPESMAFELVEPLRFLFKDEVRAVGDVMGLPKELIWRQPFPGPGLAVRCLGRVTPERLARLRAADAIFTRELTTAGWLHCRPNKDQRTAVAQAFAVLLPIRSVGVMGDQRTYKETVALRAVTTEDFMTADWARLPPEFLAKIASRIVNEVEGVNRVVYDITTKPPATIEWE